MTLNAQHDRLGNQSRVSTWVRKVFSEKEATDVPERAIRMAEEALELAQACGVDAATLHRLVDYVMSRPVGKPAQEIAGTMVTVYALAGALGVDADSEFEVELVRIQQPEVIERCQRRQHEKRVALVAATDEIERYGIRLIHEAWFTVDGGPDLVGTKDQMETVARLEKLKTSDDEKFVYEPSPYTGSDPAAQATVKEFLARTANLYYLEDDDFCDDGKTGALR